MKNGLSVNERKFLGPVRARLMERCLKIDGTFLDAERNVIARHGMLFTFRQITIAQCRSFLAGMTAQSK